MISLLAKMPERIIEVPCPMTPDGPQQACSLDGGMNNGPGQVAEW